MIRYYLTGAHEGKDIVLGGLKFEKGVHTVENPSEAQSVGNILTNFYSCITESEYFERQDKAKTAVAHAEAARLAKENKEKK